MTEQHTQKRGDGHLTVYVVWPVAVGLVVGVVLALSIGGLTGILGGTWADVGKVAGVVFCLAWALCTLGMVARVVGEWRGPAQVERLRYAELEPLEIVTETEPRFIPLKPRGITRDAPQLPAGANRATVRAGIGAAIDVLANSMKRRQGIELASTATALAPSAPAWCEEMYSVICAVYPTGSLSRRTFETLWPGGEGKRLWGKYVNGDGTGRHTGRGILHTWGCIGKTGSRGSWEWTHPLDVVFSLDRELARYAADMSGLVVSTPLTTGQTGKPEVSPGQTRPDQTNQTRREV